MSNASLPETPSEKPKVPMARTGGEITGIGTAVPRYQAHNKASATFATKISCATTDEARKVQALYRRTGIDQRGSVLLEDHAVSDIVNEFYAPAENTQDRGPGTKARNDRYRSEAPALGKRAATAALRASGLMSEEITHLVTVSCTGFNAPGIDIALIDALELPYTTQRIQVGFMGCHAAINGVRAAKGLVAADNDAKVLMCCVELCSLHYQYGMVTDHIVSNALFADGSAAVVIEFDGRRLTHPSSSIESTHTNRQSVGVVDATGSFLVPSSRDAMTWCIGDNGYQMTLSAQVPHLIERHLPAYLNDFLQQHGESLGSIGGWAVHPGGARILSAVEKSLALPAHALANSRSVLAEHGNMSSATMLFILERFAAQNQPKPWLMLGFGPGLEIEVALLR